MFLKISAADVFTTTGEITSFKNFTERQSHKMKNKAGRFSEQMQNKHCAI